MKNTYSVTPTYDYIESPRDSAIVLVSIVRDPKFFMKYFLIL